jgi:histidine kinase-like protein
VSAARALVGDVCRAWDLAHLEPAARLITSELATNAIMHARSAFDVTVAYTGLYLRIAVQDGSPEQPRPAPARPSGPVTRVGGNGLLFIAELAVHWGWVAVPTGKIVWALLRAHPPR